MNKIKCTLNISNEDLEDLLETAFIRSEYWLYITKTKHKGGFNYDLFVPEDDKNYWEENREIGKYSLTKRKLLKGLQQFIETYGCKIEDGSIDVCSIDGCDCDLILQFALFGEQVYG